MESYQVIATINEVGSLVIPAPLNKAGTRLRLVVNWEEENGVESQSLPNRRIAIKKLRGALKKSLNLTSEEWHTHKHEIWG